MIRALVVAALLVPGVAWAADVRVLTTGAYRSVLVALAPVVERETGHRLIVTNDTAGGVVDKVRAGEVVDLVVVTPAGARSLGALLGATTALGKVGIGVAVREGAAKPAIGTEAELRAAVLAARAPAWIDPAAGGSSGIYMDALWARWGIAGQVLPKAVLVHGGLVSDALLDGSADLAFQQVSELTGVPGVVVLGPLPAEVQSYTVYAGAVPLASVHQAEARAVLDWLAGPEAVAGLRQRGMEPAP